MLVGALNQTGENRPMAALQVSDGIWPGGWQRMAATRLQSGERGTTVLAQKYSAAKPGVTNYIDIIYSPPGGSSLPTPIYFVPYDRATGM